MRYKKGILTAVALWILTSLHGQFSSLPWKFYFDEYVSTKNNKEAYLDYQLTHAHQSSISGAWHFYFRQSWEGISIQQANLSIHVNNQGNIIRVNDHFLPEPKQAMMGQDKPVSLEKIMNKVWNELGFTDIKDWEIHTERNGDSNKILIDTRGFFLKEVEASRTISCTGDKPCSLAFELVYETKSGDEIQKVVVDAMTGKVIEKVNLVNQCHQFHHGNLPFRPNSMMSDSFPRYQVYPIKTESPNHGIRSMQLFCADTVASPFDWHDIDGQPGHDFTTSRGNNVEAREDIDGNNGTLGHLASGGDSLNFDFPIFENQHPHVNQDAAISNLFYWNNIMHDIFYKYGFDEAAGNFQMNNYGKGGLENDAVIAQAMDGGGQNNANFYTPVDGSQPRMQMYLWTGPRILAVSNPPESIGEYDFAAAAFGPPSFQITNEVVLANDGSTMPARACNPLVNPSAVHGKIAMVDRSGCEFSQKCLQAQNAGAIAVIVCNNVAGPAFVMGAGTYGRFISIPCIMMSKSDCDSLKMNLDNTLTMQMWVGQPKDGDFDNAIICHEYGHGISQRLTGGAGENTCLTNQEQMGEGWSDWFGLMLTMNENDLESRFRGMGTYVKNQTTTGPGIRPYPYSVDMEVNPQTYQSIATASIPHGIGSVWCSMLWEMTWALIREYGYNPNLHEGQGGNNKALAIVVEALKLQPCNPGFIDARNAILLADTLLFHGANSCLIWKSFAKRGLGFTASQGDSNNRADGQETFDMPGTCCLCVSNTLNDGNGSLRHAVDCAVNGDTISFLNFLTNDTICLEYNAIDIAKNVNLINKFPEIVIRSTGDFPVFNNSGELQLENLTIQSGTGTACRGLINQGNMRLKNIKIIDPLSELHTGSSILNTGPMYIDGVLEVLDH